MWIFIFHFRWKHSVYDSLPSAAHSNSKHQNFTPDSAQVHVHNFYIFSPARTYDKWKHWIYAADARNRGFHIILQPTASESLPHEDCVEERKKNTEKGQSSGNRSAARFLQLCFFSSPYCLANFHLLNTTVTVTFSLLCMLSGSRFSCQNTSLLNHWSPVYRLSPDTAPLSLGISFPPHRDRHPKNRKPELRELLISKVTFLKISYSLDVFLFFLTLMSVMSFQVRAH